MAVPGNYGPQQPYDPAYGAPFQPMPPTGPGTLAMQVPPPQRPSRTPLVVLVVLLAVALGAATTMLVLYLGQRSTSSSLQQQLSTTQQSLNSTKQQLSDANSQISQLNSKVAGLNDQVSSLTSSNNKLSACVTAVKNFLTALNANPNGPNVDQLAKTGDSVCGF